ncbi:acetaldehyde dehydrogenase (acetylating) [Aneurinibacillus terranovensis]|uniref:acetaldehyde dehydrogenase (acetylating) n=1 Tax=Aneurinibacillus terranovensis TaxID=278991 RepID=UPI000412C2A9|nr:acetaldehyde dehydrogenase (acetylating) [Aneurinibacillus terranovensis]
MKKLRTAIIGPGNIGTDLMLKVLRCEELELGLMVGIVAESDGLRMARERSIETSDKGIDAILERKDEIDLVFDCTGAKPHVKHAPLLREAGIRAIDLTPAAVGPYVIPSVNMEANLNSPNINLVTCGGQATIPIVAKINEVADVEYAEIVATISSRSAGPGTRQNIDEFTKTTSRAIHQVGGADRSKAIIILNPADPPIMMRNTVYTKVKNPDQKAIEQAVEEIVKEVQTYVPGYRLKVPSIVDGDKVTTIIEVEGAGDYLPNYSGNLDIITAAAVGVAQRIAKYQAVEEEASKL